MVGELPRSRGAHQVAKKGLFASPIQQMLIEQSVKGWKEIEYEVMRDRK